MSRFYISAAAERDLAEVIDHLDKVSEVAGDRLSTALQAMLGSIAAQPFLGAMQSELTRLAGVEVRSRLCHPYRFYYLVGGSAPEIVGVLHTARDIASLMRRRLQ